MARVVAAERQVREGRGEQDHREHERHARHRQRQEQDHLGPLNRARLRRAVEERVRLLRVLAPAASDDVAHREQRLAR